MLPTPADSQTWLPQTSKLKIEESQKILEVFDPIERLEKVSDYLSKELELSTVQAKIQTQAKEEMSKTQREYFLREQLRAIKVRAWRYR